MPTKEEQDELREKCTWTGTTQNGVYGCKVTGPNGKSIFLPATGCMDEGNLYDDGSWGDYWSSSLRTDLPNDAYYLYFDSGGMYVSYCYHYYGCSVRPVCQ